MADTFSLETICSVWNDGTGDRIEVGPDRDGIGLIEIRHYESSAKDPDRSFVLTLNEAKGLVEALRHVIAHPPRDMVGTS